MNNHTQNSQTCSQSCSPIDTQNRSHTKHWWQRLPCKVFTQHQLKSNVSSWQKTDSMPAREKHQCNFFKMVDLRGKKRTVMGRDWSNSLWLWRCLISIWKLAHWPTPQFCSNGLLDHLLSVSITWSMSWLWSSHFPLALMIWSPGHFLSAAS